MPIPTEHYISLAIYVIRNEEIGWKCHKPVEIISIGVPNNICGGMSVMIYSHTVWPRANKSRTVTQAETESLFLGGSHDLRPKGPGISIHKFLTLAACTHQTRWERNFTGRPRTSTRNLPAVANLVVNALCTELSIRGHWSSRTNESQVSTPGHFHNPTTAVKSVVCWTTSLRHWVMHVSWCDREGKHQRYTNTWS